MFAGPDEYPSGLMLGTAKQTPKEKQIAVGHTLILQMAFRCADLAKGTSPSRFSGQH